MIERSGATQVGSMFWPLGDFNVGCWFLRREIFLEVVAVDLLGKLLSRGAS